MSFPTTSYFGGDGSDLGSVYRLSATDWPSFVKEALGHPVLVNTTRAEFFALPKKQRDALKRVSYVTAAVFSADPSPRLYECATHCNFIALDIDSPEDAGPFARSPTLLADALSPHPFAAYLTASSTRAAPRLRIFVASDPLPIADYAMAVRYVASRLGLSKVTKESLVAVQPMYLPTIFAGEDPLISHPLIIAVERGEPVSGKDSEDSPTMSGKRGKTTPTPAIGNVEDADFLRPQVEGVTIEDVSAALEHLSPDCTYPEWLEIAAAIKHQFPGREDQEEAYSLFDAWSAKGVKYVSATETKSKWLSLRVNPKGRAPVTIRTLFHRARACGWSPTEVADKAEASLRQWLQDPARTVNELKAQGIRRIAAAALFDSITRMGLVHTLVSALAKLGFKVSLTDLKKALQALERKLPSPDDAPAKRTPDSQLPPWARGICYVSGANEFFQRMTDRRMPPEVLDRVLGVNLMKEDAEAVTTGRPSMRPQDYLLNVINVPHADHYRYSPEAAERSFILEGEKRYVNTYLPTYPEPDPARAKEAGEALHLHLSNLIGDIGHERTVMDFFAYQVQHPGKKIRWALLIQGAQGCGKTVLAEMMKRVLGVSNFRYVEANDLFGSFTGWSSGNQFVCVDEVRIMGHNRYDVMNKLKPCISNDSVVVRRMYMESITEPNITNYLLLTNYQDCIAVSDEDRRYFVLFSRLQTRKQVLALGKDYFKNLFAQVDGNAAGFRSYLEQWPISEGFAELASGHAPRTKHLTSLVQASASPLTAATQNAIADKAHPLVREDIISSAALRRVVELENVGNFTDQQLAGVLREVGYVHLGRRTVHGARHPLWVKRNSGLKDADAVELANLRAESMDASDAV